MFQIFIVVGISHQFISSPQIEKQIINFSKSPSFDFNFNLTPWKFYVHTNNLITKERHRNSSRNFQNRIFEGSYATSRLDIKFRR